MLRFTNILPIFKYSVKPNWATAEVHRPSNGQIQNVTLLPGIGIGPEITSNHRILSLSFRLCLGCFRRC